MISIVAARHFIATSRQSAAVYYRFDLKKYVNIEYRASDIILSILGFVIVSVIYYLGDFFCLVAGAVLAMLYVIIMNRRIVGEVTKKIICKR